MFKNRKDLYAPRIQARMGFLYSGYRPGTEFWELHELARKTMLTGITVYIQSPIFKLVFALIVCNISLININYFQPHKNRTVFWIAQMAFLGANLKYVAVFVRNYPLVGEFLIATDIILLLVSIIGCIYAIQTLRNKMKTIERERKAAKC